MTWTYQGAPFDEQLSEGQYGFVYLITDRWNGMRYLGKKIFRNTKTLPALKGTKRKRKQVTESNWRDYFSSNETINRLVKEHGEDRFEREIIRICLTSSEATYWESKLIFEHDALLDPNFYNDYVGCRINRRHLKAMQKG